MAKRARGGAKAPVTTEFDSAAVLKAMRAALGLSQEAFAELLGMKRQQLSAYENRHHSPSVDNLAEIAAKAGLRLEVTIHQAPEGGGTPATATDS